MSCTFLFDIEIPISFDSEVKLTWDKGNKWGNVLLFWEKKVNIIQ